MKVGVFLGNITPELGGGFTFSDDILQALIRLESKHTFVVFGDLTNDQARELTTERIRFVSSKRSFLERAKYTLTRAAGRAAAELPIIRNWLQTNWLKRVVDDLGIEFMWFATPNNYIEVDIPYLFTVFDLQHRLQPWFPEVSANGRWYRRETMYTISIPRASAVIAYSEVAKAEIVHLYRVPPEHVNVIPLPTPKFALSDLKDSDKEVLTKYHIPEGYLFYPARFWPHKNHVGLLLAVDLLRRKHNLILPVVFVGSDKGNLEYVRQTAHDLGLSEHVHFLGFVPQEDLVGLYRHAFALIYLTFFGPVNLPPLEAFALGCPVIASHVSGAQEQLGNVALLVDPSDEEQIALAIKSLYDDPTLRQTLIQRGLERAARWTGKDFVESALSILDEFEPVRRCWSDTESYQAAR